MNQFSLEEYLIKSKLFLGLDSLELDHYYILLSFFTISILLFVVFIILKLSRNNRKIPQDKTIKPTLNDVIEAENSEKVKVNNENDFVDVLVAIEEEMAAIRELYVGGYITKGIYISETDRLYQKAKIFGL